MKEIDEIIKIEWDMFDKVRNIGGRADCQDDWLTFSIMRGSQFSIYGKDILDLYLQDLKEARDSGRNVITEKYGYMMEYTEPEYFREVLEPVLPGIDAEKERTVEEIVKILGESERAFAGSYPSISGRSRPLDGEDAEDTSFTVYLTGELKTYSERTLTAMLESIKAMLQAGQDPSRLIHENVVRAYGYRDLEDAEEKLKIKNKSTGK